MSYSGDGDTRIMSGLPRQYHTPLLSLSPSSADTRTVSLLSASNSTSSAIDIDTREGFRPLVFDVSAAVRSLIWQYMDNRSAIHYLITSKRLHSLYHSFPLTEPVNYDWFAPLLTSLRGSKSRASNRALWFVVYSAIQLVLQPIYLYLSLPVSLAADLVILALIVILPRVIPIRDLLLPDRPDCCAKPRRLHRLRQHVPLPRVLRMSEACPVTDAPNLQHVEEMRLYDSRSQPITAHKLPSSLRMLAVQLQEYGVLKTDTLPPQLTVLIMFDVGAEVLQPGTLPQSLKTDRVVQAFSWRPLDAE